MCKLSYRHKKQFNLFNYKATPSATHNNFIAAAAATPLRQQKYKSELDKAK